MTGWFVWVGRRGWARSKRGVGLHADTSAGLAPGATRGSEPARLVGLVPCQAPPPPAPASSGSAALHVDAATGGRRHLSSLALPASVHACLYVSSRSLLLSFSRWSLRILLLHPPPQLEFCSLNPRLYRLRRSTLVCANGLCRSTRGAPTHPPTP